MAQIGLIGKIRAIVSAEDCVLAVFNNGSAVIGSNIGKSDIDFTVIVKKDSDIDKIIKILMKNFKFDVLEREYPLLNLELKFKGKTLDFSIFSKKTMDSFVYSAFKSEKRFIQVQSLLQHKVIEAVPVYDPGNLLKRYKETLGKYPERIRKAVFSNAIKALEALYRDWADCGVRNEFHFFFSLREMLDNICLALYSKNKRFAMVPYKRLPKDLKELKPNIEKELYFLVNGKNSKMNLERKRKTFRIIIDKLKGRIR